MKNILYFLKINKDLTFKELPFCEIDSLILTQLIYLNWEGYVHRFEEERTSLSISCFNDEGTFKQLSLNTYDYKDNLKLLYYLCNSKRYREMEINELVGIMDYDKPEQFFAMTFIFTDFIYVCYRGTDISILGWKENFDMSFSKEIPSQRDAIYYINNVVNKYNMPCYVGGHSKGGNLGLYAAIHSSQIIKNKLIKVYTFDGPGFSHDIFSSKEFIEIKDKVASFIIKNSLVGVLMFHYNNVVLVKTSGISIFQHDPYKWHVTKDNTLRRTKKGTITSNVVGITTREFLKRTSEDERQKYVNIVFNYLWTKPTLTTLDVVRHPFSYFKDYRANKKRIKEEDRKELKKFLKLFASCLKFSIKSNIKLIKKFENKEKIAESNEQIETELKEKTV